MKCRGKVVLNITERIFNLRLSALQNTKPGIDAFIRTYRTCINSLFYVPESRLSRLKLLLYKIKKLSERWLFYYLRFLHPLHAGYLTIPVFLAITVNTSKKWHRGDK